MTYIAASDYIYRVVPGARPTHDEVIDTVYWCREWVRDTFADTDVDELGDLVVLRGCESHIDGGLAFVLADVRRVNALGEGC